MDGSRPSCSVCGRAASEVLLCAGCLARAHEDCWREVCFCCGSSEPPLGPIRPRALRTPRRWRLRRRRVLIAGALLLGSGWLAAGRAPTIEPAPPIVPAVVPDPPVIVEAVVPVEAIVTVSGRSVPITDAVLEQLGIDLSPADPLAWRGEANQFCRAGDHEHALVLFDGQVLADEAASADRRWIQEYRDVLTSRRVVQLRFEDHPLPEAIAYLADMSGLNIVLEPLEDADERTITFRASDIALRDVIAIICEQHQLRIRYEEGALVLSGHCDADAFIGGGGQVDVRHARAIERVHTGDFEGALEDYALLLDQDAWNPSYWSGRAWAHAQTRDHPWALTDAERALELDGEDALALRARGWARLHMGDLRGAEADLARLLALDACDAVAWELRARLDLRGGHHADAVAALGRARELDRWCERTRALDELALEIARVELYRAWDLGRLGDRRAQLAALDRVIALDPDEGRAWNNRGCVKNELGDHAGALTDCTRALELRPDSAFALNNRARARMRLGFLASAEADLSRSLALGPRNAWAFETKAMLRLAQGAHEEARAALDRAEELDRSGEREAALTALRWEISRAE